MSDAELACPTCGERWWPRACGNGIIGPRAVADPKFSCLRVPSACSGVSCDRCSREGQEVQASHKVEESILDEDEPQPTCCAKRFEAGGSTMPVTYFCNLPPNHEGRCARLTIVAPIRHPLVAYLCCSCFRSVVGPFAPCRPS